MFGLRRRFTVLFVRAASKRRRTRRELADLKRGAKRIFASHRGDPRQDRRGSHRRSRRKPRRKIKKIVSELQVLESLMRDFAGKISEKAKDDSSGACRSGRAPDTAPAARLISTAFGHSDLLETIRASLEENRVDLYLQPIVSLPQRKLRYYEALSRLRAEDGTVIMPAQYINVAAPAGLMSVVDNLLLFRCVQIVRRLIQKNREHRHVLQHLRRHAGAMPNSSRNSWNTCTTTAISRRRSCSNSRRTPCLSAGAKGEENLTYLSSLGFALSMDHVETLALDFAR